MLHRYIHTESRPALQTEYQKMAWQSFCFILSQTVYITMRVFFITQTISTIEINTVLCVAVASTIVTDMMPIGYCIYCHNKSFSGLVNY